MSKVQFGVLALLLAVIATMVALPVLMPKDPPPPEPPAKVQVFDYKIVGVHDLDFDKEMAALGADGWDLVFARRATSGGSFDTPMYECIFKHVRWVAAAPTKK